MQFLGQKVNDPPTPDIVINDKHMLVVDKCVLFDILHTPIHFLSAIRSRFCFSTLIDTCRPRTINCS